MSREEDQMQSNKAGLQSMHEGSVGMPVRGRGIQAALKERMHQLQAAQTQVYGRETLLCVLLKGRRRLRIRRLFLRRYHRCR